MGTGGNNNLNVEKFVEMLRNEGSKKTCDDTSEFFRNMELPNFYDETKFKRGQKFYHDHIFAMFYAKLLGLISDLAGEEGTVILRATKQSSEPETAFRRYLSTILRMNLWYNSELAPGSRLWESLVKVRNYHNIASKTCRSKGIGEITQYQMSMAQFGFMGYVLARTKEIGIHNIIEEDFEGFVHFWRVIGHLLGIEERYNLCQYSLSETKLICDEVIKQVFRPKILKWDDDFLSMTEALTSGMWCMVPFLNKTVLLRFLYELVSNEEDRRTKCPQAVKMNLFQVLLYYFVYTVIHTLKFEIVKTVQRYNMYMILYVTEKFPFLAYYKFGKINFRIRTYPEQKLVYVN